MRRKRRRIEKAKLRDNHDETEDISELEDEIDIEELNWRARELEAQELWKIKQQEKNLCDSSSKKEQESSEILIEKDITPKVKVKNSVFVSARSDLPYRNPDIPNVNDNFVRDVCQFYRKTGACRFDLRCSRVHDRPLVSDTVLFSNMFSSCSSDCLMIPGDTDFSLEHDEKEFLSEYDDFYNDIVKEFATFGRILTIRTCRNVMKHLRGNVYVQYHNINEAVYALSELNGRYFAGRPLSGRFVTIESWRESICGLFHRGRCPKGPICNFLHVLLNPGESTQSLFRSMTRSLHQETRRSRRRRSDSRTCSSFDDDVTPEHKEKSRTPKDIPRRKIKSKHKRRHSSSRSRSWSSVSRHRDEKTKKHKHSSRRSRSRSDTRSRDRRTRERSDGRSARTSDRSRRRR